MDPPAPQGGPQATPRLIDLGAPLGPSSEVWIHFPTGSLELQGIPQSAANLAAIAYSQGSQGANQQRFAELGGSFELKVEPMRTWAIVRVSPAHLEAALDLLAISLSVPGEQLSLEEARSNAGALAMRRPPELALEQQALARAEALALLGRLSAESAPSPPQSQGSDGASQLETAAQQLFSDATWGLASSLPRSTWQPWVARAALGLAERYPQRSEPSLMALACPKIPERLWSPLDGEGPAWIELFFPAPEEPDRSATLALLAPLVEWKAPAGLASEIEHIDLRLTQSPFGPLLRLRAALRGTGVEASLQAALKWAQQPRTWEQALGRALAAKSPLTSDPDRTPAERAMLDACEGVLGWPADPASGKSCGAAFASGASIAAVHAGVESIAKSDTAVGVRRLDGTPWQQGSAAGRRAARALFEKLGPWARLESLGLDYRFQPVGREAMALRQVRLFQPVTLEVFSGSADAAPTTPMLTLLERSAWREAAGRRLVLEGAALKEVLEGEQRAWPRVFGELARETALALEPAGERRFLVTAEGGPLVLLEFDEQGLPARLTQLPGGRTTVFDPWTKEAGAWRMPAGFSTDSGRFDLTAFNPSLADPAPALGPAIDAPPPSAPPWGD